jgi:hypothetical protein
MILFDQIMHAPTYSRQGLMAMVVSRRGRKSKKTGSGRWRQRAHGSWMDEAPRPRQLHARVDAPVSPPPAARAVITLVLSPHSVAS